MSRESSDHEFLVPQNIRPSYMNLTDDDKGNTSPKLLDEDIVRNIEEDLELVQDLEPGVIKTYLRIRGNTNRHMNGREVDDVFQVESPTTLLVNQHPDLKKTKTCSENETRYTFTGIFGPERTQSQIFDECMHPVMEQFFMGENCLVFSYGGTNSGKTFTMQGYGSNFGVIPRTIEYIFNHFEGSLYQRGDIKPNQFDAHCELDFNALKALEEAKQRLFREIKIKENDVQSFRESLSRASSLCSISSEIAHRDQIQNIQSYNVLSNETGANPSYSIWVSFAEIYNERVYDLFDLVQRGKKRKEMKLYQDKRGQVFINDLTEYCVRNATEAYQLFLAGRENLQFAATKMNNNSSRSHSFFNVRVVSLGVTECYVYPMKVFRLSFCDLAGLERVSQTGAVGTRLKESGNINQSLLVLLRCIRAMRDKHQGKANALDIVPFRESKLARLFKSYLTSSTRICMLVTINPDIRMYETTVQVLANSAVASQVQLVRKVEPPIYDTPFCRKIRDSLGLSTDMNALSVSENDDEGWLTDDGDNENTKCATVVNKRPSTQSRLKGLEEENKALQGQLAIQEERIRGNVKLKYDKIFADQETFYKNLMEEALKDQAELHKRRVSLQNHIGDKTEGVSAKEGSTKTNDQRLLKEELERLKNQYKMIEYDLRGNKEEFQAYREEKDKELSEASQLCCSYHFKLVEANEKITSLQENLNQLIKENARLKEEEEYVHLTVEDLQLRNTELEATIDKLKRKVSKNF